MKLEVSFGPSFFASEIMDEDVVRSNQDHLKQRLNKQVDFFCDAHISNGYFFSTPVFIGSKQSDPHLVMSL